MVEGKEESFPLTHMVLDDSRGRICLLHLTTVTDLKIDTMHTIGTANSGE